MTLRSTSDRPKCRVLWKRAPTPNAVKKWCYTFLFDSDEEQLRTALTTSLLQCINTVDIETMNKLYCSFPDIIQQLIWVYLVSVPSIFWCSLFVTLSSFWVHWTTSQSLTIKVASQEALVDCGGLTGPDWITPCNFPPCQAVMEIDSCPEK